MTEQQLLHEIGLMVLGGTGVFFVNAYLPIEMPLKRLVAFAVGLATAVAMSRVAGIL